MEVETTAAPASTGGEVSIEGVDLQGMLDGTPSTPEASTSNEPTPTPDSQVEPQESTEVTTPVDAKADEQKPADQTAEEYSDPLPGKLGKLLEAVSKTSPDLARQIRADHEALNGPEGFRAMYRTVEEAREYKTLAPTVDDLKVMAQFSQNYNIADGRYRTDPQGFIHLLAEDPNSPDGIAPEFHRVVEAFEPTIRQMNSPQVYERAAKPFNQNFWRNVMGTVQREGTPEEIQLFQAFEQRYLSDLGRQQNQDNFRQQPNREQDRFRQERDSFYQQRSDTMYNEVKRDGMNLMKDETRKMLAEKIGSGIPEAVRDELLDEMSDTIARDMWKGFNGNPMVARELNEMLQNGDFSQQHKQQIIDRLITRTKAAVPSASVKEIQRVMGRIRKLQGGNGNAGKTITDQPTKDVGSGAPTAGAPKSGPMPKGAPPGFNNMKPEDRSKYINWEATDRANEDGADYAIMMAHQSGDWSKVILKGSR